MTDTRNQRTDAQHIPSEELISLHVVLQICPVPPPTWRTWIARGIAPKGIKIGPRKTLWRKSDVEAFVASRAAA